MIPLPFDLIKQILSYHYVPIPLQDYELVSYNDGFQEPWFLHSKLGLKMCGFNWKNFFYCIHPLPIWNQLDSYPWNPEGLSTSSNYFSVGFEAINNLLYTNPHGNGIQGFKRDTRGKSLVQCGKYFPLGCPIRFGSWTLNTLNLEKSQCFCIYAILPTTQQLGPDWVFKCHARRSKSVAPFLPPSLS